MKRNIIILLIISLPLTYCTVEIPVITPMPPLSPVSPPVAFRTVVDDYDDIHVITSIAPAWEAVEKHHAPIWIECQLRRGGGLGVVQAMEFDMDYGYGISLTWNVMYLEPGWYEVFCRAYQRGTLLAGLFHARSSDCTEECGFEFVEHWEVE